MTLDDLRSEVERAKGLGHGWMQFKVRRSKSPANWDRVRVLPGVYGRCIGETDRGTFIVDVRIEDVDRALPPISKGSNS